MGDQSWALRPEVSIPAHGAGLRVRRAAGQEWGLGRTYEFTLIGLKELWFQIWPFRFEYLSESEDGIYFVNNFVTLTYYF